MNEKNKRKILVINTVGFGMGGISAVIMNYYENIDKDKINMDFIANERIEPCFEEKMKENHSKLYILNRNNNPLKYMLQLQKIIKDNQYDVVHVHGNSATMTVDLLAAMMAGVKIRIAHSHNSECKHKIIHRILSPLFHFTYTKALACSNDAGEWIFGKGKFDVLPNGIQVDKYKFSEDIRKQVRKELNLEDKFVIGHVGFMNEQKNHSFLFKIFAEVKKKIPNAHLLCVTGSDVIPDDLKQLMNQLHIEDNITVLFKRNDVNQLLQAMDVFVFPSKWEGLGIAVIEAQAVGLPCIVSSEVPKLAGITSNILFVDLVLSSEKWADKIIEILNGLNDKEESYKLVEKSQFNIINSVHKLELIYDKNFEMK